MDVIAYGADKIEDALYTLGVSKNQNTYHGWDTTWNDRNFV